MSASPPRSASATITSKCNNAGMDGLLTVVWTTFCYDPAYASFRSKHRGCWVTVDFKMQILSSIPRGQASAAAKPPHSGRTSDPTFARRSHGSDLIPRRPVHLACVTIELDDDGHPIIPHVRGPCLARKTNVAVGAGSGTHSSVRGPPLLTAGLCPPAVESKTPHTVCRHRTSGPPFLNGHDCRWSLERPVPAVSRLPETLRPVRRLQLPIPARSWRRNRPHMGASPNNLPTSTRNNLPTFALTPS
jgi:hypothetical protein